MPNLSPGRAVSDRKTQASATSINPTTWEISTAALQTRYRVCRRICSAMLTDLLGVVGDEFLDVDLSESRSAEDLVVGRNSA